MNMFQGNYVLIAANESNITAVARVCKNSRTTLTEWIKHIKFGRVEKLFTPPKRRRKTILNQSQRERIEKWIEENPNITTKEVTIIALLTIVRTGGENIFIAVVSQEASIVLL